MPIRVFPLLAALAIGSVLSATEPVVEVLSTPMVHAPSQPQGALNGKIVYTHAGHGWVWDGGRWVTQRGDNNEVVEDYGNLDQMTLFVKYLFNAGATVVPLRPVGFQKHEVVMDNDDEGVSFTGEWSVPEAEVYFGEAGDEPYRVAKTAKEETATALYAPDIPEAGEYPVYCWAAAGGDRVNQLYTVRYHGGESQVRVPHDKVGNGWVYLGSYYFKKGRNPKAGAVVVSNQSTRDGVAVADAIRFGNGMGDVLPSAEGDTDPTISGYPREEESTRYWVESMLGQGQSPSIYNSRRSDRSDAVSTAPKAAAAMNREEAGEITDRVFLSFHSNAGGGRGIIGLWNNEELFPDTGTPNQERWAEIVADEVNQRLAALPSPPFELPWPSRDRLTYARRDYAFGEIRADYLRDEMDATIIETGFHDSAEDAKLLRDPKVRIATAWASYRGVVRYFNEFDDLQLDYLPDPPLNLAATGETIDGEPSVKFTWKHEVLLGDKPAGFVLYRSNDGLSFTHPIVIPGGDTRAHTLPVDDTEAVYYRLAAFNDGGVSMSSKTVGCKPATEGGEKPVLVVDAFDRLDRFQNPRQTAGPGVGGGVQTFDRVIPSRSNSFNYIPRYGAALEAANIPFDSCQNEAAADPERVKLGDYSAVIWAAGEESTADETFALKEIEALRNYLNNGGNLLATGSEIAWDLSQKESPAEKKKFLNEILGAKFESDTADSRSVTAFEGKSVGTLDDGTGGTYHVDHADVLAPADDATAVIAHYGQGPDAPAALHRESGEDMGKVVYFGFPLEAVIEAEARQGLILRALAGLGISGPRE